MTDTLDLGPQAGANELFEDIEVTFGIKLSSVDTAQLSTVGSLYNLICARTAHWESQSGSCAAPVTYYRIRRALARSGYRALSHRSKLICYGTTPKQLFQDLKRHSGLRLPALQCSLLGNSGLLVYLIGLATATAALIAAQWTIVAVGIGAVAIGAGVLEMDRFQFPEGLETVGDLVVRTAPLNVQRLSASNAPFPDRWSLLVGLLQEYIPMSQADISPDTVLPLI